MEIPVGEAQRQLLDLIARARAGEEVVLMQDGEPAARLVGLPAIKPLDEAARLRRREALMNALAEARNRPDDGGADAARSQDWLYGDDGMPA